jgi:hypothetical protein
MFEQSIFIETWEIILKQLDAFPDVLNLPFLLNLQYGG